MVMSRVDAVRECLVRISRAEEALRSAYEDLAGLKYLPAHEPRDDSVKAAGQKYVRSFEAAEMLIREGESRV